MKPQQLNFDLPKYRAFASGRERYRAQQHLDFSRPEFRGYYAVVAGSQILLSTERKENE